MATTDMISAPHPLHKAKRPRTSPYTSPIAQLIVGSARKAYYVPQDLLQNTELISSLSSSNKIRLPDVDEDTGHVLAHYLYTGTYQTLHGTVTSTNGELRTEFKRAVLAYVVAKSHGIDGLEELAKDNIEHFGASLDIFDIFKAIQEDQWKIPNDAIWFHDYFELKMANALEVEYEADATVEGKGTTNDMTEDDQASKDMFLLISRVENIAVLRALAKLLLRAHHGLSQALIETSDCLGKNPKSQFSSIEEAPEEERLVVEEPLVEAHIEKKTIQEGVSEDTVTIAQSETQPEERKDDPWASWGSDVFDTKGKKLKELRKARIPSPNNPEPQPVPEEESTHDPWGDWVPLPTKKKKKKSQKPPVPDALPTPPHENMTTEPLCRPEPTHENKNEESWRDHLSTTSRIDGRDAQDILPASTSNLEVEPGNKESEEWGSSSSWDGSKKKKNSKKSKISEPGPESILVPTIDGAVAVQEHGSAEVHDEKRDVNPDTENRGAPDATESVSNHRTAEVVEEAVHVPIENPLGDEVRSLSSPSIPKKKKKSKKALRLAKAGVSTSNNVQPSGPVSEVLVPVTSAVPNEGEHIIPTDPVVLNDSHTHVYPEMGSGQHIDLQDKICPMFDKHLQQEDQWKTCQLCQAYMHQVAVNQIRGSYLNGN